MLKDSGSRREFGTGAVRDMNVGKGRCDLLPLDVIKDLFGIDSTSRHFMQCLSDFQKTGDTTYLHEAIHLIMVSDKYFPDLYTALLELAIHFEEGAKKYNDNNWKLGIPTKVYIDSALRHYFKLLRGDTDEPHHRAVLWNLVCCIWTATHKPELNSYPEGEIK